MIEEQGWRLAFSERDLKELNFAKLYFSDFNHGTDGHNRLVIMAKLIIMLDTMQELLDYNKENK